MFSVLFEQAYNTTIHCCHTPKYTPEHISNLFNIKSAVANPGADSHPPHTLSNLVELPLCWVAPIFSSHCCGVWGVGGGRASGRSTALVWAWNRALVAASLAYTSGSTVSIILKVHCLGSRVMDTLNLPNFDNIISIISVRDPPHLYCIASYTYWVNKIYNCDNLCETLGTLAHSHSLQCLLQLVTWDSSHIFLPFLTSRARKAF